MPPSDPTPKWDEVRRAKEDKRRELVITGQALTKRVEDSQDQLDSAIFSLSQLNFLDLSGCSRIFSLPAGVERLQGLTNLVMNNNSITGVPGEALSKLGKIKVIDMSSNKIDLYPEGAATMGSLSTLNLSLNLLTEMPSLEKLTNLSHLDLSSNQLENMEFLCHDSLVHLAEVLLGRNKITSVPPNIHRLPVLKKLDLSSNSLKSVPGELADCLKLKELLLGENPFEDKRFKKMVAQKGTKAVVDYIRQHCPKMSANGEPAPSGGGGKKGKGGKKAAKKAAADKAKEEALEEAKQGGVEIIKDLLEVMHMSTDVPRVVVDEAVKEVRPFLVCFVARNLNLAAGNNLKRFIQLQTKLHDEVCNKRQAATIATHDLAKIPKGQVLYTSRLPNELKIIPLGQSKEVDAETLVNKLRSDAEQQRKEKKRSTVSGVHQYLKLLKSDAYACLVDSRGMVISFPPITNADLTKIGEETKDVFVEVTSSTKLQAAKDAADVLIREMLAMGLGRPPPKSKREDADFYSSSEDEDDDEKEKQGKFLVIEQIKVEDDQGNLKVAYPAKTDLKFADDAVDKGLLVVRRA